MKLQFSQYIFGQYSNIKFDGNPSIGSRIVPCGRTDGRTDRQTDVTKLILAFRNFANAPKNSLLYLLFRKSFRGTKSWLNATQFATRFAC